MNEKDARDLAEYRELQEYAKSLGQETYLELHARNERLRAALQQIALLDDDYHSARTAVILATDALTAAKHTGG